MMRTSETQRLENERVKRANADRLARKKTVRSGGRSRPPAPLGPPDINLGRVYGCE
jgi:hypothetical protein